MKPTPTTFGRNLRSTREAAGLKAVDVARRAGITPATLSDLETGRSHEPSWSTLRSLARVLKVAPARFFEEREGGGGAEAA